MCRCISDFKKGYQPRAKYKGWKGDMIAVSYRILTRWRKHFCQVLHVNRFIEVRQTEIQTSEPLLPVPSAFEVETATEKLKRHVSPAIDQISVELSKAGSRIFRNEIH